MKVRKGQTVGTVDCTVLYSTIYTVVLLITIKLSWSRDIISGHGQPKHFSCEAHKQDDNLSYPLYIPTLVGVNIYRCGMILSTKTSIGMYNKPRLHVALNSGLNPR